MTVTTWQMYYFGFNSYYIHSYI